MNTAIKSFLCAILLALFLAGNAHAHPEDEFCQGVEGLDPALCAALAEIDSDDQISVKEELEGRTTLQVFTLYITAGVQHILPGGLDHILFVLALFLAARSFRSLVWQISAFTIAHTVTLGLATTGWIHVPSIVVEPLIAFSIAIMALAILFETKEQTRWRIVLIFAFGLLHGLGFAGFLADLGLPDGQVGPALIGFNIGVEIGQLSIVIFAAVIACVLRRTILLTDANFRHYLVVPASLCIAVTGIWWTIERLAGAL